ncbi:MAG: site-specific integrase [Bacteroidales bacterium]|nr:site-specific integrase [Bacteroidales bacterium]MCD8388457.1 site-specific integrase [Bacteroidales bacterium]
MNKSPIHPAQTTLHSVALRLAALCRAQGQISSARNFTNAASALSQQGLADLGLAKVTGAVMAQLQVAMRRSGLCPNSVAAYMRRLRRAYRVAVAEGLVADRHPFDAVVTAPCATVKRALRPEQMTRIRLLPLADADLAYARDIFLFLYYCQGISFVDAANLRKADVCGDSLTYRRQKTNQLIYVRLSPQARAIIDRYGVKDSPYLLPIINHLADADQARCQRETAHRCINRRLKAIGALAGISTPLTTYVARHTWASIAHQHGIAMPVITAALGHTNERTTRIYLAALDHSLLASATLQVANAI